MIFVQTLFERVNTDLARKDKAGYRSAEEFNRDLDHAQDVLMKFHYKVYEETQIISDALNPFITTKNLTITNNFSELPDDYRHFLYANFLEKSGSSWERKPMDRKKLVEGVYNTNSFIRKGTTSNDKSWYVYFRDGKIRVEPHSDGFLELIYLKQPDDAVYGYTEDGDIDEEVFDSASTTNLVWPEQEESNFIDILLTFKGVATKDNELVQFAKTQLLNQQSVIQ